MIRPLAAALSLGLLVTLAGCQSSSSSPYKENESDWIVDEELNLQDVNMAARSVSQQMFDAGVLTRVQGRPAVIKVTRVRNDTTQDFNVEMVTNDIEAILLQSGKVEVVSEMGEDMDDAMDRQARDGVAPLSPRAKTDFSYHGLITEMRNRAGRTRQSAYVFQVRLVNSETGNVIWAGEKEIVKQIRRPQVGF